MPRILSGIKPTGVPHIGNYFGMMRPAIEWQERGEAFYFIADYHALTTLHDAKLLREYSRGVALDFLACGLDPAKATLFRQSDVRGVGQLTWILSTLTPLPMLENAHAYKAATANMDKAAINLGLFAYPVLMAIDILIYQSNIVPVGRDQKQHVEMTRDLALKFNRTFGETFTIPEPSILPGVETITGLDGRKMSKSYHNTIELFAEEKALRKKVMGIVTDSTPVEEPKNPDGSTIIGLYKLFASENEVTEMEERFRAGGTGYGDFKKKLFEAIWSTFEPMRKRRWELEADPGYVERVLSQGAERANMLAQETVHKVRNAIGL
ncbi:MAG TPA: tryptophan--tRNA ligase [Chthoniobacteraceae bacterium]|jgi:tryptophanyl-tRNA synthetase|nr:tryptophan--tRNA ligase [Chthoniobacteraceae bacterium]